MMKHYGVIPVAVFDGGALPAKRQQEEKRRAKRKENRSKALEFLRQGNRSAARECFQKAVDITPFMAHQLIQMLHGEGIECIVAPYEADAQLAFLSHTSYVYAVISEDSDLLPFGCTRVLFKMDQQGTGQEIKLVDLGKTTAVNLSNFTHNMFRQMCILSGCDYLPSIPGLGIKKAYGLLQKYHSMERVFRYIQTDKHLIMPQDYERYFCEAELTFLHQRVFDPTTKTIVPLTPLPDGANVAEMDFIGPPIPNEIGCQIALGNMDPYSHEYFPSCEPNSGEGSSSSAPLGTLRVVRSSVSVSCSSSSSTLSTPIANLTRRLQRRRSFQSKPLLLPKQTNLIQNYFTPTSSGTRKPFVPPRSSSQGENEEEEEEDRIVNNKEGEEEEGKEIQEENSERLISGASDRSSPYQQRSLYKTTEIANVTSQQLSCSPQRTSTTTSIKRHWHSDNNLSVLVERTPPRPEKKARYSSAFVPQNEAGVELIVTSKFFADVSTTTSTSDDYQTASTATRSSPLLLSGDLPAEEKSSPSRIGTSKVVKSLAFEVTSVEESDEELYSPPQSPSRTGSQKENVIDLTDDATNTSFSSPFTSTRRLSSTPSPFNRSLSRPTTLDSYFNKQGFNRTPLLSKANSSSSLAPTSTPASASSSAGVASPSPSFFNRIRSLRPTLETDGLEEIPSLPPSPVMRSPFFSNNQS
ncbi:Rad2 nuclease, variant 2 [Balamuthia mandrillaris]